MDCSPKGLKASAVFPTLSARCSTCRGSCQIEAFGFGAWVLHHVAAKLGLDSAETIEPRGALERAVANTPCSVKETKGIPSGFA